MEHGYEEGYEQAITDVTANIALESATTTYTVPKDGTYVIHYLINYKNTSGNAHNANGATFELTADELILDQKSWELDAQKGTHSYSNVWIGTLVQDQVINITYTTAGWFDFSNCKMDIIHW